MSDAYDRAIEAGMDACRTAGRYMGAATRADVTLVVDAMLATEPPCIHLADDCVEHAMREVTHTVMLDERERAERAEADLAVTVEALRRAEPYIDVLRAKYEHENRPKDALAVHEVERFIGEALTRIEEEAHDE